MIEVGPTRDKMSSRHGPRRRRRRAAGALARDCTRMRVCIVQDEDPALPGVLMETTKEWGGANAAQ